MPGVNAAGTGRLLLVIGVNHRSKPADLRDRFALFAADLDSALAELKARGLAEAVLLATCDRIELVSADPEAASLFVPLVSSRLGVAEKVIASALYRRDGQAALKHLFAVASALDSQVIGEPQVLGQVKAAHRAAAAQGLIGATLDEALDAAYVAARRVRRETRIAWGPVSLAAASLSLARQIHGELDALTALLIGPSEMGVLIAEQFRRAGLKRILRWGAVERAARGAGGPIVAPGELAYDVASADIVISALGAGRIALTRDLVAAALRKRPLKPIFVIDAAIPAEAEPAINDLDGAFLYNLADLERAALVGRAEREETAASAWAIIEAELAAHEAERAERRGVPAVVALRRHIERLRDEVLEEGGDAAAATRRLVNRLLHDPSEVLRSEAGAGDVAAMEQWLRRLFRLGENDQTTRQE
jgi:glutamyl-tRNA reductase